MERIRNHGWALPNDPMGRRKANEEKTASATVARTAEAIILFRAAVWQGAADELDKALIDDGH